LEEALRIRSEHSGTSITVVTVGSSDAKERIKELLAMGADGGVLVVPPQKYDYHVVSALLAEAIKKIGNYDIILCGEASIDLFSGQVGPRLAGLLNIPQITYAQNVKAGKEKVVAERNMGEQMVTTESTYPVLITVTKEINTPRLPSLMQILSSANKPIKEFSADSLGVKLNPAIETVELKGVPMERKNIVYKDDVNESIKKLVDSLAKEGVLR